MLLALILSLSLAQDTAVAGIVTDATGGAIPGATVVLRGAPGGDRQMLTGPDGRFSFNEVPDGAATLIVRAGGFSVKELPASVSGDLQIELSPAPILETVTVTPTRGEQRLGDIPASVSVLDSASIRQSPAVVADDVLRQVPTFSLFRRTSAMSANPTAQGVSLRGIGPSGVSRTLVLLDNVPFNNPFGGWVYWTRIPLEDVDRIEVVNGSSSSLYGNYAMGGVINVVSRRPTRRTVEFRPQFGSRGSRKFDFFGSDVRGKVGASVSGSVFDTDGFPQVIANERGLVDTKAAVEFRNVNVKVDYTPTARVSTFVRGGYFTEHRDNAKIATTDGNPVGTPTGTPELNSTYWRAISGGLRVVLPDQSDLQATLFYDSITYHQNTLAVAASAAGVARAVGRPTLNQRNPTKNTGGMVQWSRSFFSRHYVTAGTDWRWVDGDSQEDSYDAVTGRTVVLKRVAGGTQRSLGAFVQDIFAPTADLTITGSVRVDNWRNYDGHNLETTVATGLPAAGNQPALAEKRDTVSSPRIAALYHVTDRVNVWGDLAWGFRAPTLNELYRLFRVGVRLTLSNPDLDPERLRSGEVGVSVALPGNVTARTTWFDNRMTDPVSTIVLTSTPSLITLQRANLGRTRIRGVQTDVEARIGRYVKVSGGYLYNDAKVRENAIDPTLVGKFLLQVPKHRGSLQIAYTNPRIATVALGIQALGRQFDDEANTATVPGETKPGLPGYATVDLTASRQLTRNVDVFAGVQNMFDQEYIVQTAPTTIGAPRLVTGGLRIRFSGQ